MEQDELKIPVNKRRLLVHIILFSLIGLVALVGSFAISAESSLSPYIWQAAGVLVAIFALLAAGAKARKRSDKRAGLFFTKEGIEDNSSDISLGLITWNDIKKFDKAESLQNEMIIIHVKKDQQYIKKAKNSAIKRLLKQNVRNYGTPAVIEPRNLKPSLKELVEITEREINKRK